MYLHVIIPMRQSLLTVKLPMTSCAALYQQKKENKLHKLRVK